jgi:hypothetical protein
MKFLLSCQSKFKSQGWRELTNLEKFQSSFFFCWWLAFSEHKNVKNALFYWFQKKLTWLKNGRWKSKFLRNFLGPFWNQWNFF